MATPTPQKVEAQCTACITESEHLLNELSAQSAVDPDKVRSVIHDMADTIRMLQRQRCKKSR